VFVSSSPAEPAENIYSLVPACVLLANETVTSHTLPQRRQPVEPRFVALSSNIRA